MLRKLALLVVSILVAVSAVSCGQSEISQNAAPDKGQASMQPTLSNTPLPDSKQPIRITAPADNEPIIERGFVEGTVSDPKATVWVIVHPMEVADYWVQPSITVREGGKWRVQAYIGRPGSSDVGKHFEIMAVANPKESLKEGDKLKGWPEAQWKSQVIEVIRK